LLAAYRIGDVQQPQQSSGLLADWQDLQQRIKAEGLLDTSFAYYTRKFVELLAMVSLSMYLLFTAAPTSNLALVASALLLAMFLFQCGWLQHDYSHNA
jgi:fatty acid desaturase